jgi:hypothetical protein
MEKIELPKAPPVIEEAPLPRQGFGRRLFAVVKFILGLFLLIFVYAFTVSFLNEFSKISEASQEYFLAGIISFIAVYLFIYEPANIYRKGQRIIEIIFRFFAPLVRVAPYLLPVYALVLFVLYLLISLFVKSADIFGFFLFLLGASLILHLVFGAKSLRTKKEDFLKANYLFGFSFVYVLNIIITAIIFNILFDKFSFVTFSNQSFQLIGKIFTRMFSQLFVVG